MSALTKQAAPVDPAVQWEVVFPNGDTQLFRAEWQADHAIALGGGRKRRVTHGPSQPQRSTSQGDREA